MSEEKPKAKKVKAVDHESYIPYTLLAVIIPLAGFILGIAYMTKDNKLDRKLGEHVLSISVLFAIFWSIALFFLLFNSQPSLPVYTPTP